MYMNWVYVCELSSCECVQTKFGKLYVNMIKTQNHYNLKLDRGERAEDWFENN
jgi:hypothetical protein